MDLKELNELFEKSNRLMETLMEFLDRLNEAIAEKMKEEKEARISAGL